MSAELENQGLLDAALEISARRSKTLREIKSLLEDGRDSEALIAMKKFLNVNATKTSRADRRYPRSLALVKGK